MKARNARPVPSAAARPAPARRQMNTSREVAVHVLRQWHEGHGRLDLLLDETLTRYPLAPRDRALATELVNGSCRWMGTIHWLLDHLFRRGLKSCPTTILPILETGLYQLLALDRIPDYAAVDQAVELAQATAGKNWASVVNGVLRSFIRQRESIPWPSMENDPVKAITARYSHPAWMVRRWVSRYGVEETVRMCQANNAVPRFTLRTNRLRAEPEEIRAYLETIASPIPSPYDENFLVLGNHQVDVRRMDLVRDGKCSVQDVSAGLPARLLGATGDSMVVDLCAAPGGKAAYVAELTGDRARIIASDISKLRTRLTAENRARLGLTRLFPVVADGRRPAVREATHVLLDAPCTGFGVLSKRADLRWQRREKDIPVLVALQKQLLHSAASLVPVGGVVVYSTCTIEPEENEQVVEHFLQTHPGFELDHASQYIHPDLVDGAGYVRTSYRHGMDGSFAARLVRRA
ncbi:MAG: 16S rRNA (cytosine(967)-C(5))-methyltransferase RsmB [candidate division KSB1 bacterium]|nr:16S rRNA (cytosine(967)-C(5))-methyltransferase RsmB [candidate division KSB1 bacterium]